MEIDDTLLDTSPNKTYLDNAFTYIKRILPIETKVLDYENTKLNHINNDILRKYLVKRKTRLTCILLFKVVLLIYHLIDFFTYEDLLKQSIEFVTYMFISVILIELLDILLLLISRMYWNYMKSMHLSYYFIILNTSLIFIFAYMPVYKWVKTSSTVSFIPVTVVIISQYLPYLLLMRLFKNASVDLSYKFNSVNMMNLHKVILLIASQYYMMLFIIPFQWAQLNINYKPDLSYIIVIYIFEMFIMFAGSSKNKYIYYMSMVVELVSVSLIIVVLYRIDMLDYVIRIITTAFINGVALRSYVRDVVVLLSNVKV